MGGMCGCGQSVCVVRREFTAAGEGENDGGLFLKDVYFPLTSHFARLWFIGNSAAWCKEDVKG